MSVLRGMRVIELAEGVAGEYCGKLLTDFAAEVVKVERPGTGSPTRRMNPVLGDADGRSESCVFAFLNTGKQSIAVDLETQSGVDNLLSLIRSADAVIDDHSEEWLHRLGLTRDAFRASFPGVVFCSVTPFGQGAPRSLGLCKSINIHNASGWGYHTPSPQEEALPPLKGPGRFIVDYDAGIDAAICVVAGLIGRARNQHGDYVEVSQRSVMVSRADMIVGRMLAGDIYVGEDRRAFDYSGPTGSYQCSDGTVYLYAAPFHWEPIVALVERAKWTEYFPDDWLSHASPEHTDIFRVYFTEWLSDKSRDWVCERAQELRLPVVQVNDAADLGKSEQLQHRGFFQPVSHPVLGTAQYPTVPYRLSASPAAIASAAPSLGEHDPELGNLVEAREPACRANIRTDLIATDAKRPLSGIRILQVTKAWAGPYAGKLLALLGAEVIKIETIGNIDEMRSYAARDVNSGPIFLSLNHDVLSLQVNLKSDEGLTCLKELVAKADVVFDNIRPGAMAKIGLGYDDLRSIKEDIIAASFKMNGSDGPLSHQTGYAPCFAALGGLNSLVGYEHEAPRGPNQAYGDATGGALLALSILLALLHRERTGSGQFVDVSATECMSSMIGDVLLAYSLTGEVPRHDGNRHADMAPHGVYPCRDGEWISIAVHSDSAWHKLCHALKAPRLALDERFANPDARQKHTTELDTLIAELTGGRVANPLAAMLRQAGVAAFKSLNSQDLISDQDLWERGTFTTVTDCHGSQRPVVGPAWRFATVDTSPTRAAPELGEHNMYVYRDLLGKSEEEIDRLTACGAIY